jgi:hypothetical protein
MAPCSPCLLAEEPETRGDSTLPVLSLLLAMLLVLSKSKAMSEKPVDLEAAGT